ncbi:uncharacterized protein LOC113796560 [Dermatophagoides pteronyssinus]|uniref:uncharacterized protein LOC113796560 n=1 Tax=Dermatophagoides pteronyssinus TaxID=6956 RepID=UPI003F674A0A
MFKLLLLVSLAIMAYGSHYHGHHYGHHHHHSVHLPVHSSHHVKYYHVHGHHQIHPIHVEVEAHAVPIHMTFKSKSSHLSIDQHHENTGGSHKISHSEDEPHYLKHYVKKPIYQEVHEIITPYRKITQKIEPVHEEIETLVAKKFPLFIKLLKF